MARTRPHVKVHLAVQHHERTAEIWANAAHRGMLVELWRIGVEQYAPKRGGRIELMPLDRLGIAGNPTFTSQIADEAVESLCKLLNYRLDKYSNRWTVTVRKFARKQGIGDPELSTKADSLSQERFPQNADTEADTEAESREQKGETSGVPPSLPLSGNPGSPKPNGYPDRARNVWPLVRAEFGKLGNSTLREKAGTGHIGIMAKRLKAGASESDLVSAVRGYVRYHKGLEPNGKFDPGQYFNPGRVFRAEGFDDLVDLGEDPDAPIPERPTEKTFFEIEEDRRKATMAAWVAEGAQ